eukprot:5965614-Lingulodinium_polyedra.AAC.1
MTQGGPFGPERRSSAKNGASEGSMIERPKAPGGSSAKAGGPQRSDYLTRSSFPPARTLQEFKDL